MKDTKIAKVSRMHASGMRPSEIAAHLGQTPRSVHQLMHRARVAGLIPSKGMELRRKSSSAGYSLLQKKFSGTSRDIGSMKQILYRLTPDCIEWLANMTPDGAAVADVIAGIIVDACEEDPMVISARAKELKDNRRKVMKEFRL